MATFVWKLSWHCSFILVRVFSDWSSSSPEYWNKCLLVPPLLLMGSGEGKTPALLEPSISAGFWSIESLDRYRKDENHNGKIRAQTCRSTVKAHTHWGALYMSNHMIWLFSRKWAQMASQSDLLIKSSRLLYVYISISIYPSIYSMSI